MKAQGAVLAQLSRDDPATPGTDGHELELGEPLSDRALYSDWLNDENPPIVRPLTVGGAIDYERPRIQMRLAREAQDAHQAALLQAALEKALAAELRAYHAEQVVAGADKSARLFPQSVRGLHLGGHDLSGLATAEAEGGAKASDPEHHQRPSAGLGSGENVTNRCEAHS